VVDNNDNAINTLPEILLFNLNAEYYMAHYELELYINIQYFYDPDFTDTKINQDVQNEYKNWKESNLSITDILNVSEKTERISKLKKELETSAWQNDIDKVKNLILKNKMNSKEKEEALKRLQELDEKRNDNIPNDPDDKRFKEIKTALEGFNLGFDLNLGIVKFSIIGRFLKGE
jgi:hypothetical protein